MAEEAVRPFSLFQFPERLQRFEIQNPEPRVPRESSFKVKESLRSKLAQSSRLGA